MKQDGAGRRYAVLIAAILWTSFAACEGTSGVVDVCGSYQSICKTLLDGVGCAANQRNMSSCNGPLATGYAPLCTCGQFDMSVRTGELIVDAVLRNAFPQFQVVVANHTDLCGTYAAACSLFLTNIGCASGSAQVHSCPSGMNDNFEAICKCGLFEASFRVQENVNDDLVKADLLAHTNASIIDVCWAYNFTCNDLFLKSGCPLSNQTISSCGNASLASYNGACACGAFDTSNREGELICDRILKPFFPQNLVNFTNQSGVDVCGSYLSACSTVLQAIQCPLALKSVSSCGAGSSSLSTYSPSCSCGQYDVSDRIGELINDAVLGTVSALIVTNGTSNTTAASTTMQPATAITTTPMTTALSTSAPNQTASTTMSTTSIGSSPSTSAPPTTTTPLVTSTTAVASSTTPQSTPLTTITPTSTSTSLSSQSAITTAISTSTLPTTVPPTATTTIANHSTTPASPPHHDGSDDNRRISGFVLVAAIGGGIILILAILGVRMCLKRRRQRRGRGGAHAFTNPGYEMSSSPFHLGNSLGDIDA